jgi:hypothetical protein
LHIISFSQPDFLTQVNGKAGFNLREMGDKSGTQMVLKQMKAVGPKYDDKLCRGCLVSTVDSTSQYSRQKYMPVRHVQHWTYIDKG